MRSRYFLNLDFMVNYQSKVSVIVPCYNVEQYLPKCRDCILAQTYHNLEVWLVDDGKFLGKKFEVANYSPMRLYGVMRNYLILWHKYSMPIELKRKIVKDFFLTWTIKILLGEKDKIKAIFTGVFDGLFQRKSRRVKFL